MTWKLLHMEACHWLILIINIGRGEETFTLEWQAVRQCDGH